MAEHGGERVALVTGASAGFGASIASALADAGWRVYGSSRRAACADPRVTALRIDVDDDLSVEAGVADIVSREGRLDAIVCNAGFGIAGAIEDTTASEAKAQFETNFFGTHRVCRAALPHLRARPLSHIVVIGSLAGVMAIPFQGMYSASKWALEGYCEALRMEVRGTSVRVTILEPGDFRTEFTAKRILAAGSGAGSRHAEAFARALKIIEADETGGADPRQLADAVRDTLDDPAPPVRRAVGAPGQVEIGAAKAKMNPDDFEAAIASHFGLA